MWLFMTRRLTFSCGNAPSINFNVLGHWAMSDHVLQTSCLVTTNWVYHWHQLSLSCLLLHYFIAFCACMHVGFFLFYEVVNWAWFPVLAQPWNTKCPFILLINCCTRLTYFTCLWAWHCVWICAYVSLLLYVYMCWKLIESHVSTFPWVL